MMECDGDSARVNTVTFFLVKSVSKCLKPALMDSIPL